MSIFTWGAQPKSQVDPETVEEAITRIVAQHEHDPASHLGENESIEAHRSSEIIDHLAQSVVADKITDGSLELYHFSATRFYIPISPKDLDFSNAGVSSFASSVYAEVTTGPTANVFYSAFSGGDQAYTLIGDGALNPHFRIRVVPVYITSMESYFGIGSFDGDSALGFKIVNSTLYTVWWDNYPNEYLNAYSAIDVSVPHNYEVSVISGVSITWLVDGIVLKVLPWQSDISCEGGNTGLMFFVKKTTTSLRTLVIYQIIYEQDYF